MTGIAVKPGVVHQIQTSLVVCDLFGYLVLCFVPVNEVLHLIRLYLFQQTVSKLMKKFGVTPTLSSVDGGVFPQSSLGGDSTINPLGNMMKLATGPTSGDGDLSTSEKLSSSSSSYASRTEKVISNFLQSPLLEGEAKNQV